MNTKIFILIIVVSIFISCSNNHSQNKPKQETPKALETESSSSEFVYKRGYNDLVTSIYNELVTKDTDLKTLEKKIDELSKSKNDSTQLFDDFNEKNQAYFSSADRHISAIKDSILRDKIKSLVANQLTKYNSEIAKQSDLLKIIETKQLTINDLHNILKIVRTLPIIDKYQKENLPNSKPLEGYIMQQNQTIKLVDTLSKK